MKANGKYCCLTKHFLGMETFHQVRQWCSYIPYIDIISLANVKIGKLMLNNGQVSSQKCIRYVFGLVQK